MSVFEDSFVYWNIDDSILSEDSLVYWNIDDYTLSTDSFVYWNIGYTYKLSFPYVNINWDVAPNIILSSGESIGYFDSVIPTTSEDAASYTSSTATDTEKETCYTFRLYIQLPDTGEEIEIDPDDIISWSLKWGLNSAIIWGVKLSNAERQYTSKTGDYRGLFAKGVWSYTRKCRKFIRMEISQYLGNQRVILFNMPRLVINKRQQGSNEYQLSIGGIDEISEYLKNRRVTINSYCGTETLTPIASTASNMESTAEGTTGESIGTSYNQFQAYSLTRTDFFNRTEVLINGINISRGQYTWDSDNLKLTVTSPVLEKYRVKVRNPMSAKWIFSDIARQIIDLQETTKEYFPIICDFSDFEIFEELHCIDSSGINTYQELITAFGGEYLITPVGDRLSLVIRKTPVDSEYPEAPNYRLLESLYRGTPEVNSNNLEKFNTINVIRPSITEVSYEHTVKMTDTGG